MASTICSLVLVISFMATYIPIVTLHQGHQQCSLLAILRCGWHSGPLPLVRRGSSSPKNIRGREPCGHMMHLHLGTNSGTERACITSIGELRWGCTRQPEVQAITRLNAHQPGFRSINIMHLKLDFKLSASRFALPLPHTWPCVTSVGYEIYD